MFCFGKFDPVKLAVIAAFFTVIGDTLALIIAIKALRDDQEEKKKNIEAEKQKIKQHIIDLQSKLSSLNCK